MTDLIHLIVKEGMPLKGRRRKPEAAEVKGSELKEEHFEEFVMGVGLTKTILLELGFTKRELKRAVDAREVLQTYIRAGGLQAFYWIPAKEPEGA